jgi:ABC-type nitrate/sulfonate/bicarbonate transport system substrate-binding protein
LIFLFFCITYRKMKQTITLEVLVAIMVTLLLGGCGGKKTDSNHIRVVLDWTPNTNHSGLYAAQDKGSFAEEGLTVQIIQPPEDGALALVGAGSAEFGFDFQESMGPAIAKDRDALPLRPR